MFKYVDTTKVPLTPALAAEFAAMPAHKGERPKRAAHVQWLLGKIEKGLFHPPRWAVVWLGGKKYRVNGQHSSAALTLANGHFPHGLTVLIDEYACDSDDDVADLFAQFDPKQSLRTDTEIIMATARQHDALNDLSKTAVKSLVDGLALVATDIGEWGERATPAQKRALVGDNLQFILWAKQWPGTDRLRRPAVVAAIHNTWSVDAAAAETFWKLVRDENHPDAANASRKLGRFLSLLQAGQEFNKRKAARWTTRAVYAKCVRGWNAYRKSGPTDLPYSDRDPLPKPI